MEPEREREGDDFNQEEGRRSLALDHWKFSHYEAPLRAGGELAVASVFC